MTENPIFGISLKIQTRFPRTRFPSFRPMRKFIIPAFIAGFGVIWLLDTLGIVPPLNVVWTLGLLAVGIGVFAGSGFHKESFPWGSFFIASAVCSVMRQMDMLTLRIELPLLVIILGVLLAINQTAMIPARALPRNNPPPPPL